MRPSWFGAELVCAPYSHVLICTTGRMPMKSSLAKSAFSKSPLSPTKSSLNLSRVSNFLKLAKNVSTWYLLACCIEPRKVSFHGVDKCEVVWREVINTIKAVLPMYASLIIRALTALPQLIAWCTYFCIKKRMSLQERKKYINERVLTTALTESITPSLFVRHGPTLSNLAMLFTRHSPLCYVNHVCWNKYTIVLQLYRPAYK